MIRYGCGFTHLKSVKPSLKEYLLWIDLTSYILEYPRSPLMSSFQEYLTILSLSLLGANRQRHHHPSLSTLRQ